VWEDLASGFGVDDVAPTVSSIAELSSWRR
jgi:hypothetical protein